MRACVLIGTGRVRMYSRRFLGVLRWLDAPIVIFISSLQVFSCIACVCLCGQLLWFFRGTCDTPFEITRCYDADPVRMRKLYPDLAGANPLVRGRQIDAHDIQRFQQFGLGLFVNVEKDARTPIDLKKNVQGLLDVFVRRVAARTMVFNDKKVESLMDWPHLRADLRSNENFASSQDAQDLRAKLPSFWITMKQLRMSEMLASARRADNTGARDSNNTMRGRGGATYGNGPNKGSPVYSGLHATTLDPGGDCHRQPIVKLTAQELHVMLASDVCFVTGGNDTARHFRCTSKGMTNETNLTLPTTSQHGIMDRDAFFEAKKLYKVCGANATRQGQANNTKIFVWNASSRLFEPRATRDETSLSRRVRISPIWNLLSRLKGTAVHNMMNPQHAWGQTDARRHDNPRWANNTASANKMDALWQSSWVYSNTDAQCKNKSFGIITKENWYNNPNKAATCLSISNDFIAEQGTCMRKLGNSFDICQIDELKDFCYAIHNIRTEIRQINAAANQYTNKHKNLYMPSRYMKQDGIFGWSAIVETYNTIDPALIADGETCPGIQTLVSNSMQDYKRDKKCSAQWVFEISNFLESIRNIVGQIVSIIVLAQEIAMETVIFLFAALAGDKNMQAQKVEVILAGLKELLSKIVVYYREMLIILWDVLTSDGGVFEGIDNLMKNLCIFAKQLTVTLLDMATGTLKVIMTLVSPLSAISKLCALIDLQSPKVPKTQK